MAAYREPEEAPLGQRVRQFRLRAGGVRLRIGVGSALAGVGAITDTVAATTVHPAWVAFVFFGMLVPFAGATMLVSAYRDRGLVLEVYEEGMMEHRGARHRRFRWEDVVTVTSDLRPRDRRDRSAAPFEHHTIKTRTGIAIDFTDAIADCNELIAIVKRKTLPSLLARALEKIETGERVDFGEFRASRDGIEAEYDSASWEEIVGTEIVDDFELVIKGRGATWMETRMLNVQNPHVLVALIDRMAKGT